MLLRFWFGHLLWSSLNSRCIISRRMMHISKFRSLPDGIHPSIAQGWRNCGHSGFFFVISDRRCGTRSKGVLGTKKCDATLDFVSSWLRSCPIVVSSVQIEGGENNAGRIIFFLFLLVCLGCSPPSSRFLFWAVAFQAKAHFPLVGR
ncbi:hypothetical protein V8C42DRAFT_307162 [Trichoderma barbatum]